VRELLWDYALGHVAAEERNVLELELARSPELRAELAEIRELSNELAYSLPKRKPAAAVKTRLFESIAAPEPFTPWIPKLAKIADLTFEAAREQMKRIYDPTLWQPSGLDGLSVIPFIGGPLVQKAICCFVRLAPGFYFPRHRHGGTETSLIFQGGLRDSIQNIAVRPGDIITHEAGSEHHYTVDKKIECLGAVIGEGGIEMLEP
jgi:hypothetical protein